MSLLERQIPRRTLLLLPFAAALACSEQDQTPKELDINLSERIVREYTDKRLTEIGIAKFFLYTPGDSKTMVVYGVLAQGSSLILGRQIGPDDLSFSGFVPFDKTYNMAKAQQELNRQYKIKEPVQTSEENGILGTTVSQASRAPVIVRSYEPPLNIPLMYVAGFPSSYRVRGAVPKTAIPKTKFKFTAPELSAPTSDILIPIANQYRIVDVRNHQEARAAGIQRIVFAVDQTKMRVYVYTEFTPNVRTTGQSDRITRFREGFAPYDPNYQLETALNKLKEQYNHKPPVDISQEEERALRTLFLDALRLRHGEATAHDIPPANQDLMLIISDDPKYLVDGKSRRITILKRKIRFTQPMR